MTSEGICELLVSKYILLSLVAFPDTDSTMSVLRSTLTALR